MKYNVNLDELSMILNNSEAFRISKYRQFGGDLSTTKKTFENLCSEGLDAYVKLLATFLVLKVSHSGHHHGDTVCVTIVNT